MAKYRYTLPQVAGDLFLTDGGIETTLIFHYGLNLPHFSAFHLFASSDGQEALERYFRTYAGLARKHGLGLVLETATWRARELVANLKFKKMAYETQPIRCSTDTSKEMTWPRGIVFVFVHFMYRKFKGRN